MKAQRGSKGIVLLFFLTSAVDGVDGQIHDPGDLPPGKTRYPEPVRTVTKNLPPHRGSIPGPPSP